jgi:UDP-N-acetylglucosamine--N-acetylmuramyl-(pentapeptide) pyrophosphoryl-undecaprenol N-acetylglucosamine transferase
LTIVLTGGGSGGHITPILAIAAALKHQDPEVKLIYIGQKGDKFAELAVKDPNVDKVYSIYAGKFRRFHGEGLKQLLDLPTLYKNIRDLFYVLIGIMQSWHLTKEIDPDIVFSRGGYVSVPVSLGAHLNQIPYITHDSDPIPSLANRMIGRWAKVHAVALPKDIYPYKQDKTVTTGIPINKLFVKVDEAKQQEYRKELSVPEQAKMLFVIGGGLGSQTVNKAICEIIPHLIRQHKDLYVFHVAGNKNEDYVKGEYKHNLSEEEATRVKAFGYIENVHRYSGAADVIITRAGATNLAEFAAQGKACIVIPSPFLTGGHQLKSAEFLDNKEAAIVFNESDLTLNANKLAKAINDLLANQDMRKELSINLADFARPNATKDIADLIIKNAKDEAAKE